MFDVQIYSFNFAVDELSLAFLTFFSVTTVVLLISILWSFYKNKIKVNSGMFITFITMILFHIFSFLAKNAFTFIIVQTVIILLVTYIVYFHNAFKLAVGGGVKMRETLTTEYVGHGLVTVAIIGLCAILNTTVFADFNNTSLELINNSSGILSTLLTFLILGFMVRILGIKSYNLDLKDLSTQWMVIFFHYAIFRGLFGVMILCRFLFLFKYLGYLSNILVWWILLFTIMHVLKLLIQKDLNKILIHTIIAQMLFAYFLCVINTSMTRVLIFVFPLTILSILLVYLFYALVKMKLGKNLFNDLTYVPIIAVVSTIIMFSYVGAIRLFDGDILLPIISLVSNIVIVAVPYYFNIIGPYNKQLEQIKYKFYSIWDAVENYFYIEQMILSVFKTINLVSTLLVRIIDKYLVRSVFNFIGVLMYQSGNYMDYINARTTHHALMYILVGLLSIMLVIAAHIHS
ncbi:MAG: hypothetical protein ISR65_09500 [Bacteriovoracaceae bacterium]|nr:hypothetical protein [Bacteriovoracaceae bacterium]